LARTTDFKTNKTESVSAIGRAHKQNKLLANSNEQKFDLKTAQGAAEVTT